MLHNYCFNYAFKKMALTSVFTRVFGKAKVHNAKFIITVVVSSAKNLFPFGSILLAVKVVMNENVNFNSFQFQKMGLHFKNSDFCVISESHSILSLWPDGTTFFSSKTSKNFTPKMFNLFWRPKYLKLQINCSIWILVQTVFFVHARFEHDTITERA